MHFVRCCAYISFLSLASAFSVSFSTPSQCDPFTVSWSGGQEPFEIILTPRFSPLINQSVPSSAFSNGKGSYTFPQLQIANETQFLLTMSDATGFGSGGTTTLLTTGLPIQNNECNTKLTQDFYFSALSQLKQCAQFNFSNYAGAIGPVTAYALIPGGMPTTIGPSTGPNMTWIADVSEGTSLLFIVIDSQGRQGGASDIEIVQDSTDASCLVAGAASSTVTATSQPTSVQFTSGSSTPNAGVIAGATVGSVVGFGLLVILAIWCRRRAKRSQEKSSSKGRSSQDYKVAEDGGIPQPFPFEKAPESPTDHANMPATTSPAPVSSESHFSDPSSVGYGDNGLFSSAGRRLAAMAGRAVSPSYAFPYQTGPTGLPQPIIPASQSPNDPHAPFSQMQPVRQFSDPQSFAGYGDVGNAGIQIAITPQYMSAGNLELSASDNSSPIPRPQPSPLSSNIERFASSANGGNTSPPGVVRVPEVADQPASPTQYIVHTDVEDVRAVPGASRVVELPPQYADRPLTSQHTSSEVSSP